MPAARHRSQREAVKVLLIGGTSHVGKSTWGGRLAAALGFSHLSTDQLARHPGRPWRDDRSELPGDVVDHYSSLTVPELVEDVLKHYQVNVWPIAEAIVRSRVRNRFDPGLVLEGSALLPELVCTSQLAQAACVWLTADDEIITARIKASSRFNDRSDAGQKLIEAFIGRSLALNAILADSARRHGARCLSAGTPDVFDALLSLADAGRNAPRRQGPKSDA